MKSLIFEQEAVMFFIPTEEKYMKKIAEPVIVVIDVVPKISFEGDDAKVTVLLLKKSLESSPLIVTFREIGKNAEGVVEFEFNSKE